MVAWRVAKSLLTLRDQWKAAHPGAANPGFIGDADHASRDSDHNPWVDDPDSTVNVVTAGDFYHQPAIGADAGKLAEALKAAKDPRVKYVIWNRRIWSLARDGEGWRPYDGDNPHTGHVHVSVSSTKARYDDTRKWVITQPAPAGGTTTTPPPGGLTMADAASIELMLEQEASRTLGRYQRAEVVAKAQADLSRSVAAAVAALAKQITAEDAADDAALQALIQSVNDNVDALELVIKTPPVVEVPKA